MLDKYPDILSPYCMSCQTRAFVRLVSLLDCVGSVTKLYTSVLTLPSLVGIGDMQ